MAQASRQKASFRKSPEGGHMLHSHKPTLRFCHASCFAIHFVWKAPLSFCPHRSFRKRYVARLPSHMANTSLVSEVDTRLHRDASLRLFLHSLSSHKSNRFLSSCSPSLASFCVTVDCFTKPTLIPLPTQRLNRNASAIDLHCAS